MLDKNKIIKTLIVDDHLFIAEGVKSLLENTEQFEVTGICNNGLEVYDYCLKNLPELIILDLSLPGMDGLAVLKKLKGRWPQTKIVCLSADTKEITVKQAIDSGASGYVLKRSSQETLLKAINNAFIDQKFIDEAIQISLISPELDQSQKQETPKKLTPRELQILKLVAEGHKNRDIAELLVISLKTVEAHRLNLMRKLQAHNALDLMNWANRLGLRLDK